jgi:lipopolysaccharide/colanic/teichoic acid biosynthesis glycosyltransferase
VVLHSDHGPVTQPGRWAKRTIDLAISIPLLVLAAPLLFAAGAAIIRADRGPMLFRQEREGRAGKPFAMFKLRTMHLDAEARAERHLAAVPDAAALFARSGVIQDDPRIIRPVGEWCRRYSLDELPQLLNVIRGDMSLVGPRPLEPWLARVLMTGDQAALRNSVLPGISGAFQVSRRDKSAVDERMIAADLDYVTRWNLRRDIGILLRTPAAMLAGRGVAHRTS